MTTTTSPKRANAPAQSKVSHNLAGQKLGRKGLETRERIVAAMLGLLDDANGPTVTLTSVAQEAATSLTNLYLYFPDFETLLLSALDHVMASPEAAFIDLSRTRWPDEGLGERCLEFTRAHYRFWKRHARILHMRNTFAETDPRIFEHRQSGAGPLLDLLRFQMGAAGQDEDGGTTLMATAVLIGFERIATVVTGPLFHVSAPPQRSSEDFIDQLIRAEARLIEVAIRDQRALCDATAQGRSHA